MPLPTNDLVISSWAELQEALFRDTWDAHIGRFRSPFVYRGLRSKDWSLTTSLQRLGGEYHTLENHLLRNFRKYGRDFSQPGTSVWNWLALAQHHGLPTRLLDWTYSPYVALHFATDDLDAYDQDGVIWAIDYVKAAESLPPRLRDALRREGSNVFTPELLEPLCPTLRDLEDLQDQAFLLFLEPPSLDARIVHQYALFSLMNTAQAHLHSWLQAHPELFFRIVLPAGLKWEVRDKLDQANITERVLFPGLGGLSRWLHRHYTPTNLNE
ncbi:FRG domain-containing protein [Hymenobacter weizhouensis]|uniref:FRG domain-containing protein n=1 Tax=Hymenobacter sp. YIM 151500-1 TaxID=2987689 RepID=UPI002226DD23|nr:FRG domain-containing protein [Hymenobacter sp. YIM 151500-1]UYZ63002.1 FRG domain-containing protein [Hymenobacter sp. YIM 151500-1]